MKPFLLIFSFLMVLILCFLWFSQGEDVFHNYPETLKLKGKTLEKQKIPTIDKINFKNSQISNFCCKVHAVAQMTGNRAVKLNGRLSYEKEKKFRLELESFLGPELDVGSDGSKFWFWSEKMQKPGLYWATYENFEKTRLKTPFNPFWLSQCLGVDVIDYKDSVVEQQGPSTWRVITRTTNAKKEPVLAVTHVDPQSFSITGHSLYDNYGVLEASSEIQDQKISFIWHKEKASMVWHLYDVRINSGISRQKWEMPNIKPKIDMSLE